MNGRRQVFSTYVRVAALLVAVAVAIAHLVDFGVYDLRIAALNSLTHDSVAGIVSLLALAVAALAALALSFVGDARRRDSAILAVLLAVLLALRLAQPSHVLILALPFTIVAFYLLWTTGEGETQRLLREGCVVLVLAFGLHAVGTRLVSALGYGSDTWPYQLKAVLKHSGELGGWMLVAGGLIVLVLRGHAVHAARPSRQPERRPA